MNKILVVVYVPIVNINLDFWIPSNKKVGEIKKFVYDILSNNYKLNNFGSLRLLDRFTGVEFNSDLFISQSNINNGSKLVLI